MHSVCQEINEVMKRISCKPKALPHYFGRGIHAIDVLDYAKNEGTLQVIRMPTILEVPMILHSMSIWVVKFPREGYKIS